MTQAAENCVSAVYPKKTEREVATDYLFRQRSIEPKAN